MLIALLLSSIAAASAVERFHAEFPAAHRIASVDGQHLVHASGFALPTPSRIPEIAARAFLSTHGAAFGVTDRQALVVEAAPAAGVAGAVRFRRTIDGFPVFNGNLVVGVDGQGRVFLVNGSDVPASISGRRVLSEASARRAAIASFPMPVRGAGPMTVVAGWRVIGPSVRPVYRVDFISQEPAGDWRLFVDAETGTTLFREDLRRYVEKQGLVYEVSPSESAAGPCPLTGNARLPCVAPAPVTFINLTTGADLRGAQTTVFNCKGGDPPASLAQVATACGNAVVAANDGFDFAADTAFPDTDARDDFSAAMAYFHLDKHISLFKTLDPTLPPATSPGKALRAAVPALVNVQPGGQPFDNAFFSGGLDAMVFGQGASADFAYDATVAYHELTHGVIFAWGDFNIDIDALGGLDEPGAVNEGSADTMASAETGRSEIGSFVTSVEPTPAPFIRDMNDPLGTRSCQGNGTIRNQFGVNAINGLNGEVHDDGEIWNGLAWEVFSGLRAAGIKGCDGACEAGPALQYKAIQLSASTSPTMQSYWLNLKAAASALFPSRPEVAGYVDCVGRRRGFDKCDRTVKVYAGEDKVEFIRLRYSTFQIVLEATTPASPFLLCNAVGGAATVHIRNGLPVQLSGIDPNTGAASFIEDASARIAARSALCPRAAALTLPFAGTWYVLLESPNALIGRNPGFELFLVEPSASGFSTRPFGVPPICDTPSDLAIDAPATVPPRGHLALTASAGSGSGYIWSLPINGSGGGIDAETGAYTAGPNPNGTDVVEVDDSAGNIRTKTIAVGPGVTVSPAAVTLPRRGKATFFARGGSGTGFTWSFVTNASGGSIDSSNGQYKAGRTPGVTDMIRGVDSLGNGGVANIEVNDAPPVEVDGGCSTGGGPDAAALLLGVAALFRRRRSRPR